MKRASWIVLLSLTGCDSGCDIADLVDGAPYDVFANLRSFEIVNGPSYPAQASPVNGPLQLAFRWPAPDMPGGEVVVEMDGQPFNGAGTLVLSTCGGFDVTWSGQYLADPALGTGAGAHEFEANGTFLAGGGRIEGVVSWSESWTAAADVEGQSPPTGTLVGEVQFRGLRAE